MCDGLSSFDRSIEEMDRKEARRQKDKMMWKNKREGERIETKHYKRKRKKR